MTSAMADLIIYADAGGSKTVARGICGANGRQFEVRGGACVPSSGIAEALGSIEGTIAHLIDAAGMTPGRVRIWLALASAGIDDEVSKQSFLTGLAEAVHELRLVGDGEAALMGCVGDRDGAVISVGTGVAAFAKRQGQSTFYDGWGWPYGDRGGGAHIGREAVAAFLEATDFDQVGLDPLHDALVNTIGAGRAAIFVWLASASRKAAAALAPLVAESAAAGSHAAAGVMADAAGHIQRLIHAIRPADGGPVYLTGGAVGLIEPYLQLDTPIEIVPDACLLGARHLAVDWLSNMHRDALRASLKQ